MVPCVGVARTINRQRIGYRRIVQLLVYLVIVPTVAILSLGIVTMFQWEIRYNLILGVLMVSLVALIVTGTVLVLVFVRREANLSELQADFVSKVSHELRTPLTAIRLFVETMNRCERAGPDAATLDKCLGALVTETARLGQRIERLLDWGRMEAGRKQYELKDEPVAGIIEDTLSAFSPLRVGDSVTLTCDVEAGLPTVHVDRHALVDALVNLLSNAHKYGGTPAVVKLRAYRAGEHVAFEVTDNGEGIPRPEHRRIFDKFYRRDDRLSRSREGSGLGLAIVKHVVRAHRGKIALDSERGRGSTFRMLFPVGAGGHS